MSNPYKNDKNKTNIVKMVKRNEHVPPSNPFYIIPQNCFSHFFVFVLTCVYDYVQGISKIVCNDIEMWRLKKFFKITFFVALQIKANLEDILFLK